MRPMSELGHLQTSSESRRKSAPPPKADVSCAQQHFRLGPQTEVRLELSEFTIRFGLGELSA